MRGKSCGPAAYAADCLAADEAVYAASDAAGNAATGAAQGKRSGHGTMLQHLRHATREAHARVETAPCLAVLTTPALNWVGYRTALQRLYSFHSAYQPLLPALLHGIELYDLLTPSLALAELVSDLGWLGTGALPAAMELAWQPTCATEALGALYVIEGSVLGGRVIGRHVSQSLGVTAGRGGSFFCATRAEAARQRWQSICALLEQGARGDAARDRMLLAATQVFASLGDFLCVPEAGLLMRPVQTAPVAA